jgi:hypothetical protein
MVQATACRAVIYGFNSHPQLQFSSLMRPQRLKLIFCLRALTLENWTWQGISSSSQRQNPLNSATKTAASTLGVPVGLAGIEHGIFELLQGNFTPNGLMIEAVGPSQRFW